MEKTKHPIWFLLFSLAGFAAGAIVTNSYKLRLCFSDSSKQVYDVACHDLLETIGNPLYYGAGALALVFLVLTFLPKAWSTWKKFAIWYVPLAALLFIFYPEPGSGDLLSPYPETVYKWVSGFYVLVSLVVIAQTSLRKGR